MILHKKNPPKSLWLAVTKDSGKVVFNEHNEPAVFSNRMELFDQFPGEAAVEYTITPGRKNYRGKLLVG